VCASDTLVFVAYQVMRDQGLRPGTDIGLIGFDDSDFAQEFGLTSVQQPLAEIARTLLTLPDPGRVRAMPPSHGVLFEPIVVARRSTDHHGADRRILDRDRAGQDRTDRSRADRSTSAHEPATTDTAGNRTHDGDSS
jgi:Periplasmic binding protein-like domain